MPNTDNTWDAVVIGAGAAGLFCAGVAGQRGLRVLVLDHSPKVAEKIRISGGGRANFTNRDLDPRAPHKHFLSQNPNFCRSALSRYTPQDFTALLTQHGVPFHEKHKGQLFCDRSADDLIQLLLNECAVGGVTRWQPCGVHTVRHSDTGPQPYVLETDRGMVHTHAVVVATGGLSIPAIGASDFGHRIARQFDLPTVTPRPGLVPLSFDAEAWAPWSELSGLALSVHIETGEKKQRALFAEDLLFTHRGLSGPGVLQISSYWQAGTEIRIQLAPDLDWAQTLRQAKARSRKRLDNELAQHLLGRLAETWASQSPDWQRPISEVPDKALMRLAEQLSAWRITPTGTEGYKKAEVTLGGVDTQALSSQTMESRQAGLYFIGEVVDVTGWLGGYNFQWAWSSGYACGQALKKSL